MRLRKCACVFAFRLRFVASACLASLRVRVLAQVCPQIRSMYSGLCLVGARALLRSLARLLIVLGAVSPRSGACASLCVRVLVFASAVALRMRMRVQLRAVADMLCCTAVACDCYCFCSRPPTCQPRQPRQSSSF